jgi:hypothetical protein
MHKNGARPPVSKHPNGCTTIERPSKTTKECTKLELLWVLLVVESVARTMQGVNTNKRS